jgi:hypothetical protein
LVMGTNTASIMYADNQYVQNPFLKFRINKTPQSTTWVKKEAEAEAKKSSNKGVYQALTFVPPASLSICTSTTLTTSPLFLSDFSAGDTDPLKKLLPSWMISGGYTKNTSRDREGSGPTLELPQQDPPQAKQHNFNGLLHPFFRLRSSLGGKAL